MANSPVKLWRRQKQFAPLLGKEGKIAHFTIVRVPPKGFSEQAPYPVAIVKIVDGDMMIGQIVDWDQKHLKVGQKVIAVLRRGYVEGEEDVISYVIKFKPQ